MYILFLFLLSFYIEAADASHDPLTAASQIAIAGMEVQSERLKVISQNIANAEVTGSSPSEDPYQRKTIFFEQKMDSKIGTDIVSVKKISTDKSDFILKYQPSHPAANAEGYVKYPNVNIVLEGVDMQEARRSFDANVNSFEITKSMQFKVLELMKN